MFSPPYSSHLPSQVVFLKNPVCCTCFPYPSYMSDRRKPPPDFIILTMLGDPYESQSSSLCDILNHPLTSHLVVASIPLNTQIMLFYHNKTSRFHNHRKPSKTHTP